MQVNFDQYIRNFRIFYQQLSKGHKDQAKLQKNMKLLLQNQTKKWKKTAGFNRNIIQSMPQTQSLKKVRQIRKQKQKATINIQALHTSKQLENCIIFGYIYMIFETKNVPCYELLTETLNLFYIKSQKCTSQLKRKLNYAWNKFDQYMYNKKIISIRYDKLLIDYFKDFPQIVLDYFFQTLFSNTKLVDDKKAQFFQQISNNLQIKIIFFEINGSNVTFKQYGPDKKISMKIGYYIKQEKYINVMKIPQKQQKQIKNEWTYKIFGQISTKLQAMYTENMPLYLGLNNLKNKIEPSLNGSSSQFNNSMSSFQSQAGLRDKNFSQLNISINDVAPSTPATSVDQEGYFII